MYERVPLIVISGPSGMTGPVHEICISVAWSVEGMSHVGVGMARAWVVQAVSADGRKKNGESETYRGHKGEGDCEGLHVGDVLGCG